MKDMNPTELDTNEWIDPTIKRLGKEKARLTRGGPGDKSTPGNVDTSEWWQDVSKRTKETRAFTPIKGIPVKDMINGAQNKVEFKKIIDFFKKI